MPKKYIIKPSLFISNLSFMLALTNHLYIPTQLVCFYQYTSHTKLLHSYSFQSLSLRGDYVICYTNPLKLV